ncbi:unnamed protein product [Blepharisma stoltei]|uniref:Uncharacterized protein n=1 Tax=Blepharisma stoltei TaxID=1481888 RepID=A0AAU9ISW9_9CILI|nr:unnamed protein product [Blepharisma stoltei]
MQKGRHYSCIHLRSPSDTNSLKTKLSESLMDKDRSSDTWKLNNSEVEKEFLVNIHNDMAKARNVISRLRSDKKKLKNALKTLASSYENLERKNSELVKSLEQVSKDKDKLEVKMEKINAIFDDFENLKRVIGHKDEEIGRLKEQIQNLEKSFYSKEKGEKEKIWKKLMKTNSALKDDLQNSRSNCNSCTLSDENPLIYTEIIEKSSKMIYEIQKNHDISLLFAKSNIYPNHFNELLRSEQWNQAILILLSFTTELVQNHSYKSNPLFRSKPKHNTQIKLEIPSTCRSGNLSALLSPSYNIEDVETGSSEVESYNNRLAKLNQEINSTMLSSKKLLQIPPRKHAKSLSMSLKSHIKEEDLLSNKLEFAEKQILTDSSLENLRIEESALIDFDKYLQKTTVKPVVKVPARPVKEKRPSRIPILRL